MLVYEILREWGSPPIKAEITFTSDISQELQDKMEKLGITPKIFRRIQDAGKRASFEKDLSIIIDSDSSERWRFEQLYLKGFWEVVKIDGVEYTFSKISGMSGEEQIRLLWKTDEKTQIAFGEFLEKSIKTANQRKVNETAWEGAANKGNEEKEKRLKELEEDLQSSTNQIRSLSSLPPDIERDAFEEAKKNPPAELKNISPDKYGDYKNLILANYAISHNTEIREKLSDADKKIFSSAINDVGSILGRKIEDFETLTSKKITLGEGRVQIETRGRELIEKWYNKEVVWNSNDRTITFTNKSGEVRVIETARMPPRESVEREWLRIGRNIDPINPDEKEKNRLEKENGTLRWLAWNQSTALNKTLIREDDLTDSMKKPLYKSTLDNWKEKRKKYDEASTPDAALESIKALKWANSDLEKIRRGSIDITDLGDPKNTTLEDKLFREMECLSQMETILTQLIQNEEQKKKYQNIIIPKDNFDLTGKDNLSWLISRDFHKMWPRANEALTRIIAEMNRWKDEGNKIKLESDDLEISVKKSRLEEAWWKLTNWYNLKNADDAMRFVRNIGTTLNYNRDHPLSLESQINGTYEQAYKA
jgi:hypothetical protein